MIDSEMTAEAKLIHMYGFGLSISIHAWPRTMSYMGPTWWHCDIKQEGEGVKLEIEGRGETFEEAVGHAYGKYMQAIYRGMPRSFQGQMIEGPGAAIPPETGFEAGPKTLIDEEIPF